jgi:hypothetical protein
MPLSAPAFYAERLKETAIAERAQMTVDRLLAARN